MIDIILDNIYRIIGAVLLASFVSYLAWRNSRKNRLANASEKFRNIIIQEFKGFWPTASNWPESAFSIRPILKEKEPRIETAVADFKCHLGIINQFRFSRAWQKYKNNYYESLLSKIAFN